MAGKHAKPRSRFRVRLAEMAAAAVVAGMSFGVAAAVPAGAVPSAVPVAESFGPAPVHSGTVAASTVCLDSDWSPGNGHPVYLWKCGSSGAVNQQLTYNGADKALYFTNTSTPGDWCLSDNGGYSGDVSQVDIESCTPGSQPADQQVTYGTGGLYTFADTGKVLDDKAFGQGNGNPVFFWTANGGANQLWSAPFGAS